MYLLYKYSYDRCNRFNVYDRYGTVMTVIMTIIMTVMTVSSTSHLVRAAAAHPVFELSCRLLLLHRPERTPRGLCPVGQRPLGPQLRYPALLSYGTTSATVVEVRGTVAEGEWGTVVEEERGTVIEVSDTVVEGERGTVAEVGWY